MAKETIDLNGIDQETRKAMAAPLRAQGKALAVQAKACFDRASQLDPDGDDPVFPDQKPAGRPGSHRQPASARQATAGGKTPTEHEVMEALAPFENDNPVALVELSKANGWNNDRANAVVNSLLAAGEIGSNGKQKGARRLFGIPKEGNVASAEKGTTP